MEEAEAEIDDQEYEDASLNYGEPADQMHDQDDEAEENAQDVLAAAGLEDSDAEDEVMRTAWNSFF